MDHHVYQREIMEMAASLDDVDRRKFITVLQNETQNPVVVFGFSAFLGGLGVDRFVIGDALLGILKLITLGGFGVWIIIDWFIIGNRTRDKNMEKARYIYDSLQGRYSD